MSNKVCITCGFDLSAMGNLKNCPMCGTSTFTKTENKEVKKVKEVVRPHRDTNKKADSSNESLEDMIFSQPAKKETNMVSQESVKMTEFKETPDSEKVTKKEAPKVTKNDVKEDLDILNRINAKIDSAPKSRRRADILVDSKEDDFAPVARRRRNDSVDIEVEEPPVQRRSRRSPEISIDKVEDVLSENIEESFVNHESNHKIDLDESITSKDRFLQELNGSQVENPIDQDQDEYEGLLKSRETMQLKDKEVHIQKDIAGNVAVEDVVNMSEVNDIIDQFKDMDRIGQLENEVGSIKIGRDIHSSTQQKLAKVSRRRANAEVYSDEDVAAVLRGGGSKLAILERVEGDEDVDPYYLNILTIDHATPKNKIRDFRTLFLGIGAFIVIIITLIVMFNKLF